MDPGRRLKALWLFLAFSALICLPAALYFTYVAVEARNFRLAAENNAAAAISAGEQHATIAEELAKEYGILEAMLEHPANRDNPDLSDFIEGRREHLMEIGALLRNAEENLDEGRIALQEMGPFDYDALVYAEICFEVACKKIKEAGEELLSYRKMI